MGKVEAEKFGSEMEFRMVIFMYMYVYSYMLVMLSWIKTCISDMFVAVSATQKVGETFSATEDAPNNTVWMTFAQNE